MGYNSSLDWTPIYQTDIEMIPVVNQDKELFIKQEQSANEQYDYSHAN